MNNKKSILKIFLLSLIFNFNLFSALKDDLTPYRSLGVHEVFLRAQKLEESGENPELMLELYRLNGERGHNLSSYKVATFYNSDDSSSIVPKNLEEYLKYLKLAANQNHPEACYDMSRLILKNNDYEMSLSWLFQCAFKHPKIIMKNGLEIASDTSFGPAIYLIERIIAMDKGEEAYNKYLELKNRVNNDNLTRCIDAMTNLKAGRKDVAIKQLNYLIEKDYAPAYFHLANLLAEDKSNEENQQLAYQYLNKAYWKLYPPAMHKYATNYLIQKDAAKANHVIKWAAHYEFQPDLETCENIELNGITESEVVATSAQEISTHPDELVSSSGFEAANLQMLETGIRLDEIANPGTAENPIVLLPSEPEISPKSTDDSLEKKEYVSWADVEDEPKKPLSWKDIASKYNVNVSTPIKLASCPKQEKNSVHKNDNFLSKSTEDWRTVSRKFSKNTNNKNNFSKSYKNKSKKISNSGTQLQQNRKNSQSAKVINKVNIQAPESKELAPSNDSIISKPLSKSTDGDFAKSKEVKIDKQDQKQEENVIPAVTKEEIVVIAEVISQKSPEEEFEEKLALEEIEVGDELKLVRAYHKIYESKIGVAVKAIAKEKIQALANNENLAAQLVIDMIAFHEPDSGQKIKEFIKLLAVDKKHIEIFRKLKIADFISVKAKNDIRAKFLLGLTYQYGLERNENLSMAKKIFQEIADNNNCNIEAAWHAAQLLNKDGKANKDSVKYYLQLLNAPLNDESHKSYKVEAYKAMAELSTTDPIIAFNIIASKLKSGDNIEMGEAFELISKTIVIALQKKDKEKIKQGLDQTNLIEILENLLSDPKIVEEKKLVGCIKFSLASIYSCSESSDKAEKFSKYLTASVGLGNPDAQVIRAKLSFEGKQLQEQDIKYGLELLEAAYNQGSVSAAFELSKLYYDGKFVEYDKPKAEAYAKVASEKNPDLLNEINFFWAALIASKYDATQEEYDRAEKILTAYAESGNLMGYCHLGVLTIVLRKDPEYKEKALTYFKIARTLSNNPEDKLFEELGLFDFHKCPDIKQAVQGLINYCIDPINSQTKKILDDVIFIDVFSATLSKLVVDLIKSQAEGVSISQNKILFNILKAKLPVDELLEKVKIINPGQYYTLQGAINYFEQKYENALENLKEAAELNIPEANFIFGIMHQFGHGVEKNLDQAAEFIKKSLVPGFEHFRWNLAEIYLEQKKHSEVQSIYCLLTDDYRANLRAAQYFLQMLDSNLEKNISHSIVACIKAIDKGILADKADSKFKKLFEDIIAVLSCEIPHSISLGDAIVAKDFDELSEKIMQCDLPQDNQILKYIDNAYKMIEAHSQVSDAKWEAINSKAEEELITFEKNLESSIGNDELDKNDITFFKETLSEINGPKLIRARALIYIAKIFLKINEPGYFHKAFDFFRCALALEQHDEIVDSINKTDLANTLLKIDGELKGESLFWLATIYSCVPPIKDNKLVIEYLKEACELDHPESLTCFGAKCLKGSGVPKDIDYGITLYKRADELNCNIATHSLALIYYEGKLVPKNKPLAIELFNKAAQSGLLRSKAFLAQLEIINGDSSKEEKAELMKVLIASCEAKDQEEDYESYFALGFIYYKGIAGVQDYTKAYDYFSKASEKCIMAKFYKALMTYEGYGITKNPEEGIKLFEDLVYNNQFYIAKKELAFAYFKNGKKLEAKTFCESVPDESFSKYILGKLYLEGYFGTKDENKAKKLFEEASSNNDCPQAVVDLAKIFYDKGKVQKAIKILKKSKDLPGQFEIKLHLADIYIKTSNFHDATELFISALSNGAILPDGKFCNLLVEVHVKLRNGLLCLKLKDETTATQLAAKIQNAIDEVESKLGKKGTYEADN